MIQMIVTYSYLTTIPSTVCETTWPSLPRVGEISHFKAVESILLSNQEASLEGGL